MLRDYRQNQVMKKVTSWAAIIAVPTLVTGYYGMNVPYPGSGETWGVVAVLGDRGRAAPARCTCCSGAGPGCDTPSLAWATVAVTELEQRWLAAAPVVERVELDATSWVDVVRGLILDADAVHDELLAAATWEQGKVFRYEKYVPEPRMMGALPPGRAPPGARRRATTWLTRRYRVPVRRRRPSCSTATSATASASTATASCAGSTTRSSASPRSAPAGRG